MSAASWLLVWFLGLIALGTAALMVPVMSPAGGLSLVDAAFTAASAVCVTGLMVLDIEGALTVWGRVTILTLIQCGGIGIITFASVLILTATRKLTVHYEDMLDATLAGAHARSVRQIAFAVIRFTVLIELAGTLALVAVWPGDVPWGERLWGAAFHAISAFCNAGIGLYSNNLEGFAGDTGVILVAASLIILGGFGFTNFNELFDRWRNGALRWSKFSLFLKVSIVFTVVINLLGTVILFAIEFDIAFRGLAWGDKLVAAFFHAVTTRTAGFDVVAMAQFSDLSLRFMMMLMFVGAVSGSCAGGIKLSSLAVLLAMMRAHLRNDLHPILFNRRISRLAQNKAVVLAIASVAAILIGVAVLSVTEGNLTGHMDSKLKTLALEFEVVSALGTVGLSLGMTSGLTTAGKAIIIALMIIGRLGPLALFAVWADKPHPTPFTSPEEPLTVG